MSQSKDLTAFYREYAEWLNKGAPAHSPFHKDDGLCFSLYFSKNTVVTRIRRLKAEMLEQFIAAGLHEKFPFNNGDHDAYLREARGMTMHLNPARTQWVKDHCQ